MTTERRAEFEVPSRLGIDVCLCFPSHFKNSAANYLGPKFPPQLSLPSHSTTAQPSTEILSILCSRPVDRHHVGRDKPSNWAIAEREQPPCTLTDCARSKTARLRAPDFLGQRKRRTWLVSHSNGPAGQGFSTGTH